MTFEQALEIIERLVVEHGESDASEALRMILVEGQKPDAQQSKGTQCHHQYGSGSGKCRKCGANIVDVTN